MEAAHIEKWEAWKKAIKVLKNSARSNRCSKKVKFGRAIELLTESCGLSNLVFTDETPLWSRLGVAGDLLAYKDIRAELNTKKMRN